jgi:hypothetical protein
MPDNTEKIKDFLNEVILFAKGKNTRFVTVDEMADQAFIILAIEQLSIQINTLESIKHLLTEKQIIDIDNLIRQYEAMKAKLYGSVMPL